MKTYGINTELCDGYVFNNQRVKLFKALTYNELSGLEFGNNLVLNPISYERRLNNTNFLTEAIKAGRHAEDNGQHYHPAANKCLDILSLGLSSKIQLESLISNTDIARRIVER